MPFCGISEPMAKRVNVGCDHAEGGEYAGRGRSRRCYAGLVTAPASIRKRWRTAFRALRIGNANLYDRP
jgi:hypothetical protein